MSIAPQKAENPVKAERKARTGFSSRNAGELVDMSGIGPLTSCMPCRDSFHEVIRPDWNYALCRLGLVKKQLIHL